jgi:hypothetical protein
LSKICKKYKPIRLLNQGFSPAAWQHVKQRVRRSNTDRKHWGTIFKKNCAILLAQILQSIKTTEVQIHIPLPMQKPSCFF